MPGDDAGHRHPVHLARVQVLHAFVSSFDRQSRGSEWRRGSGLAHTAFRTLDRKRRVNVSLDAATADRSDRVRGGDASARVGARREPKLEGIGQQPAMAVRRGDLFDMGPRSVLAIASSLSLSTFDVTMSQTPRCFIGSKHGRQTRTTRPSLGTFARSQATNDSARCPRTRSLEARKIERTPFSSRHHKSRRARTAVKQCVTIGT